MFCNIFNKKRVLITGNTGFKGSWLTCWLLNLGAEVDGFSNDIPTAPTMYKTLQLDKKIHQTWGDIRDFNDFNNCVESAKPDFLFHLAAQAIVSKSYKQPLETITTNVIGTANVLETLKQSEEQITAVIITSDKAYDNVEWSWGYRENDRLGGKDIYSGSKGAAELVIKSYWHSFLKDKQNIKLGATASDCIELSDQEANLIQNLSNFPSVVKQAGADYSPALIANYIYELVKQYNSFYHDFSILKEENEEKRRFRLLLSKKVAEVIKSGMYLLGIEVPERM